MLNRFLVVRAENWAGHCTVCVLQVALRVGRNSLVSTYWALTILWRQPWNWFILIYPTQFTQLSHLKFRTSHSFAFILAANQQPSIRWSLWELTSSRMECPWGATSKPPIGFEFWAHLPENGRNCSWVNILLAIFACGPGIWLPLWKKSSKKGCPIAIWQLMTNGSPNNPREDTTSPPRIYTGLPQDGSETAARQQQDSSAGLRPLYTRLWNPTTLSLPSRCGPV